MNKTICAECKRREELIRLSKEAVVIGLITEDSEFDPPCFFLNKSDWSKYESTLSPSLRLKYAKEGHPRAYNPYRKSKESFYLPFHDKKVFVYD